MEFLNYHHLRYFRAIAHEKSMTKASARLRISQSALSLQLRKLEESLGHPLFHRRHKSLILTEAGRIALDYSDLIFKSGEEMMATLHQRPGNEKQIVRVGAVATLSRNFQIDLLRPLLPLKNLSLVLRSGSLEHLLIQLKSHTIDLILSTQPVQRDGENHWQSYELDSQPVSLVAGKGVLKRKFRFPEDLEKFPLLLPSVESNIRTSFDLMIDRLGIHPVIMAEIDDMALLRLVARESAGIALVPQVVVQDELEQGKLIEVHRIREIKERFYAITAQRRFPNDLVKKLLLGKNMR